MSSVLNTCMRCRSLRRKLILEFLGRAEAWWEKSAFFFFFSFIYSFFCKNIYGLWKFQQRHLIYFWAFSTLKRLKRHPRRVWSLRDDLERNVKNRVNHCVEGTKFGRPRENLTTKTVAKKMNHLQNVLWGTKVISDEESTVFRIFSVLGKKPV